MKNNLLLIASVLTISLLFTSCEKDDPIIPDEPELITTLNYMLSPANGGDMITLSFQDLDGDGGEDPIVTGGTLAANTSYVGRLELLNEAESPAESITEEIQEEEEEHQFFFQSSISDLSVSYNDEDSNDKPVGLSSIITTGAAASGTLTIILRHEPNKSATNVADGDITNAGGETDIEVTFSIDVQ